MRLRHGSLVLVVCLVLVEPVLLLRLSILVVEVVVEVAHPVDVRQLGRQLAPRVRRVRRVAVVRAVVAVPGRPVVLGVGGRCWRGRARLLGGRRKIVSGRVGDAGRRSS